MARYIDADLLIENIAKIEDLRTLSTKTVGIAISATPTADVVEVVRCKDCKHWLGHPEDMYGDCGLTYTYLANYDFCSEGERKDT